MSSLRSLSLLPLILAGVAYADIKPYALFSDHAVLQRDTEVPVWGVSDKEGEKVSVTLDDKPAVVTTAKDGKWMVKLPANPAGGPHTLTIAGDNKVVLKDILFGEVWICSGQSNMGMTLSGVEPEQKPKVEELIKGSVSPKFHLFNVKRAVAAQSLQTVSGSWRPTSPGTMKYFSLVGQFFGRDLKKALGDVPVGLIESDWGGTPAESWTSADGLAKFPALAKATAAVVDPAKPQNAPSVLHNGMIAPLMPYAIRGVVWYQGEANAKFGKEYRTLFPILIADWRAKWGRGDFPFLFVQIAPHKWVTPELREAQFLTLKAAPNTAMVQTIDVGDAENIHPLNKEPVGQRLALAARHLVYGETQLEYSGPLFSGANFSGGKAVVSFTHADKGLELKEVKDGDFQVAGADKKFHPATAKIEGGKLVVASPKVASPVAVRYGWSRVPNAALWNKDGLPASPFRSDVD